MNSAYFLTVEWCGNGQRGVFCDTKGKCFRKDGEPHTREEMHGFLGVFWMILSPKSESFTVEELAQFTSFTPLAEYSNEFGIVRRKEQHEMGQG